MDLSGKFHRCGSERQYSAEYDAYYCELCNEWLEETCEDLECKFCQNRPEKPSMIDNFDKLK
jgi:hypothetical protein